MDTNEEDSKMIITIELEAHALDELSVGSFPIGLTFTRLAPLYGGWCDFVRISGEYDVVRDYVASHWSEDDAERADAAAQDLSISAAYSGAIIETIPICECSNEDLERRGCTCSMRVTE